MAHNARTEVDGVWITGYSPSSADWQDLERKIFTAANGVDGGAYACSAAVVIGGSGLQVTGPTLLVNGAAITCATGPAISDSTFPLLGPDHVGRSRKIVTHAHLAQSNPHYSFALAATYLSPQTIALGVAQSDGAVTVPELWIPLRVHDGSTIAQAMFTFRVPAGRSGPPTSTPKFRIVRVLGVAIPAVVGPPSIPKRDAGEMTPLKSQTPDAFGFTADKDGFVSPTLPSTPEAWYALGEAQEFTYVADIANVVDISQYSYFAHIIEESDKDGAETRIKQAQDVRLATSTYLSSWPPIAASVVIDGVTAAAGDRVLIKDQQVPGENGIYVVTASGHWNRVKDRLIGTQFSPGEIVYVAEGTLNANTVWQLAGQPPYIDGPDIIDDMTDITGLTYGPIVPRGNIHHSVQVAFSNIVDTRWQ